MGLGAASCERVPPLCGFRVGVTADRRADEQAELLRRRGADVVLAPAVSTRPFGDDRPLREATDALLSRPPDVMVATTGIGIRSWFAATESWGIDDDLRRALGTARIVSRGPKASAALVGVGLAADEDEPTERLNALVTRLARCNGNGVAGRRVALQLYGEDVPWAVDELTAAGAEVVTVPVYRWTSAEDLAPARRLLDEVLAGQVDAVTFTSAAAVRTFASLADDASAAERLRQAFASSVVAACVGPVTDEAAAAIGFKRRTAPARGRLGLLVRALSRELHRDHRHLRTADHELVVQGATVCAPNEQVILTEVERLLLTILIERPGLVLSRDALRRRVWAGTCGNPAVDKGISRLRRALEPVGLRIDVVSRRGWLVAASALPCAAGP